MKEPKLYTCFETTNHLEGPVYVIYSAKLSDFHDKKAGSKPVFNREAVINGLRSMGCGVFDSKIVFAGGLVTPRENKKNKNTQSKNKKYQHEMITHDTQSKNKKYQHGMITYDTQSKVVSYDDIPPMEGLKMRPLVFELYERLYVLNTSPYVRQRSFEIYYPKQKAWGEMPNPYFTQDSASLGNKNISGRTPYCWFVFGNCLCISSPGGPSHLHHARRITKCFISDYQELLPFRGMATTYSHPDFSDIVVIYLSQKGLVEGRQLTLEPHYFGEPAKIFKPEPFKPVGELSTYFADFGEGNFCLTLFDNVSIHVYMFTIDRLPNKKNGALNLKFKRHVYHKYEFSYFSLGEGYKSVSFLGCFALPADGRKKRVEEANLYLHHFPYEESGEIDDDISSRITQKPPLKTKPSREDDWEDTDSDSDSDVAMYV